ncbi:MAG: aldo/keto reductase [Pseudomonadota bacterium]
MIEKIPFGRTGHHSSRVLFGAAALGAMSQSRADSTLELLAEFGINHIDTAAKYGDSELRLKDFLTDHRQSVFLATKTDQRDGAAARAQLEASLERMGVDQVDLIQLHNLARPEDLATAFGPEGAVEALQRAQTEGLVRFVGVTGHGTYIAERHLESLSRFEFASVLLPYSYSMMKNPQYAADFEALYTQCQTRGIAVQTIKAIAQRRWREGDDERRLSWYKPLRDPEAIARAVNFVLARPGLFLNTTSDATLLRPVLEAASNAGAADEAALAADHDALGIEPLFVRDVADDVLLDSA